MKLLLLMGIPLFSMLMETSVKHRTAKTLLFANKIKKLEQYSQ